MKELEAAKAWLATMAAHTDCCGVPQMRALIEALSTPTPTAQGETDEARLGEHCPYRNPDCPKCYPSPASQNVTISDEMVERAVAAWNGQPDLEKCGKCEGRGYHHGFGEGGVDPDWCTVCGGSGHDIPDDVEKRMMHRALTAALSPLQENT